MAAACQSSVLANQWIEDTDEAEEGEIQLDHWLPSLPQQLKSLSAAALGVEGGGVPHRAHTLKRTALCTTELLGSPWGKQHLYVTRRHREEVRADGGGRGVCG